MQHIDWPRALFRGHYMNANAWVVHYGIPMDTSVAQPAFGQLGLVTWRPGSVVAGGLRCLRGRAFSAARFLRWCERHGVAWPCLPSGAPRLDKKTLEDLKDIHPTLRQLREVRSSLGAMRLTDLAVGSDGHNRTMLSSFGSLTARNTPSNSKSVFGPATWIRGLIKPAEGEAIAYLDFSAQENAISAALSGDARMVEDYASGDPYLAFAIANGLAPPGPRRRRTRPSETCVRFACWASATGWNSRAWRSGRAFSRQSLAPSFSATRNTTAPSGTGRSA